MRTLSVVFAILGLCLLSGQAIMAFPKAGTADIPPSIIVPPAVAKSIGDFKALISPDAFARIDPETKRVTQISGRLSAMYAHRSAMEIADLAIAPLAPDGLGVKREDLTFSEELKTPFGTTVIYQQTFLGRPIVNARLAVEVTPDPQLYISIAHSLLLKAKAPLAALIDGATATATVNEQFLRDVTTLDAVDPHSETVIQSAPTLKRVLYAKSGRLWDVFDIVMTITRKNGRAILAQHEYFVDSRSGKIIDSATRLHRFRAGKARVFDPNPIVTLGTTTPSDDDLMASLSCVTIPNLEDPSSGVFSLTGRFARIVDVEEPADMPRNRTLTSVGDPDFSDKFNDIGFAAVMAYYHVDRLQQRMISLGFPWAANVSQQIDVSGFGDGFSRNSVYQNDGDGKGTLVFARDSQRYVAEDAEVIAHEYGHAILARKTQVRFGIRGVAPIVNEGFADYWGISSFLPQGASPPCYAPWLGGGTCFRTISRSSDINTLSLTGNLFEEGDKWTATLFDVADAIGDHDRADAIIYWGHVKNTILGSDPTMPCIADAIVHTAALASTPEVVKKVCTAFTNHGLVEPSSCSVLPVFPFMIEVDCH